MTLEAERPRAYGADAYEFRTYLAGDEHELVALFNRVFRSAPDAEPRSLAEWRWTFLESPGGFRLWLALARGAIVAQSAGIGYRVECDGRATHFSQSVDSLVHPDHRGGLKHPGLFVRTVEPYIAAYGAHPDLVFFGWPNRAAARIGSAFLGYERLRRQEWLVRALGADAPGFPNDVRRLRRLPADCPVDALWSRCARHFGASVIRDAAFLRWRFERSPARRYEWLALGGARPAGLVALGLSHQPFPRTLVLSDWLVPEDEPAAGAVLLAAARARAAELGVEGIVALFPPWSAWSERFRAAGFRTHASDAWLTVRSHCAAYDVSWLREHWWYQPAESDWI